MARLVTKTAKGPKQVGPHWICMCGLSENQPFCDGSHKSINETDDETYIYTETGPQVVTEITVKSGCHGCAHCTCGNKDSVTD